MRKIQKRFAAAVLTLGVLTVGGFASQAFAAPDTHSAGCAVYGCR